MRVCSYVITKDRGSAPNYEAPCVTLAICKPRIRCRAEVEDLIIAFNGAPLSKKPHSVRWAGIVSEVIPFEGYWTDPRFRSKRPAASKFADNIYRTSKGGLQQVPNQSHGPQDASRDIRGKNALAFYRTWYFGDKAPELPSKFELRVVANRRLEPLRQIGLLEWQELEAWFEAHSIALPEQDGQSVDSCRSLRTTGPAAVICSTFGSRQTC